ncbi:MBL fold metallo-hydrolase [Clostridioides sp. ES-S-0001-02]|uniref:MBL fold metallo-hydrolase n=1 Tax=Clostridioides sp. ES-S-0001-02 TaxID=2770770 RepID=UPI001D115779|nr:MBL fold metallo-hydrolase [Clostridioides sp. ES-S-0001-02]
MKVISLIENISGSKNLKSEHGLSLFLEINDKSYILDTGKSGNFIENAKNLNVDLLNLDALVISHNHSDHIGGIDKFFEINKDINVYIKSQAKLYEYFYHNENQQENYYIGNRKGLFEDFNKNFIWIDDFYKLSENLYIFSDKNNNKDFFCRDKNLLKFKDNMFIEDDFKHELFLVYVDGDYVSIISSCSHSGIVNIAHTVKKYFPDKSIKFIIGGFHMDNLSKQGGLNCSTEYIDDVIKELNTIGFQKIYTFHCTGLVAFDYMKKLLGDKIEYFKTGDFLEV